ncbi:tunicamycin resistance protein [Apophysomyces sp. BC1015]|nr:tunicamycin resistance protein [Apophysomyces sp. BC1015]KAG0169957.1 tunicamycin resistance protein [Apophysomyces sp. BC1021]
MGVQLVAASAITLLAAGLMLSTYQTLIISAGIAIIAGLMTWTTLPTLYETFLNARLSGVDILKPSRPVIPETMGLPTAIIYLIGLFIFMPFPFMDWFDGSARLIHSEDPSAIGTFPYRKLGEILAAILAIQSMVLLGFADDVLDVRWRYKVWFPAIAGIPLLIFYYTNEGATHVMIPLQLRSYLGDLVDLGSFYYVYMVMVIIFCTHSINILAGINGIEAGQSLVISCSVIINDLLFLYNNSDRASVEAHLFSLYFMLPFAGVTTALLWHNWFPAKVFVGDTFCYFAGMTLAVLFRLVECPRHRMPRLADDGLLRCSTVTLESKKPMHKLGRVVVQMLHSVGLVKAFKYDDKGRIVECNNFTLLNLVLAHCGPMSERNTTCVVLCLQVMASMFAFFVRYKLIEYVYDKPV